MKKGKSCKCIESLASNSEFSDINPLDLAKAWTNGKTDYLSCTSFGKARCYCPKDLEKEFCKYEKLCHDYNLAHLLFHSGVTLFERKF